MLTSLAGTTFTDVIIIYTMQHYLVDSLWVWVDTPLQCNVSPSLADLEVDRSIVVSYDVVLQYAKLTLKQHVKVKVKHDFNILFKAGTSSYNEKYSNSV